jgi:hypothetical protein
MPNEVKSPALNKPSISCWRFASFFIKAVFTDQNEFFRMHYGWCSDIEEFNELANKFERDRLKRLYTEEELDKELTFIKNNSADVIELKIGLILVNDAEGYATRYVCT